MNALATPTSTAATALPSHLSHFRRIVLTGFMGAGKSTVGRLLAEHLGWSFLDLDQSIEDRSGLTVPQIFEHQGEEHFRRMESAALASALRLRNAVLALGGGAPESLTNRLLLEQTPGTLTVFLDAPFPVLFDRCMLQNLSRPVFADPGTAQARFEQRHPLYRRIAQVTVATSALTPEQTVTPLLHALSRLPAQALS